MNASFLTEKDPATRTRRAPSALAYLHWHFGPDEPVFYKPGATGLSAHVQASLAINHGLMEVIERDAAICSWILDDWPVDRLAQDVLPEIVREATASAGFNLAIFDIGPDLPVRVSLAIAIRRSDGQASVGTACRPDLANSVIAATCEALILQDSLAHFSGEPVLNPYTSAEHLRWASQHGDLIRSRYAGRSLQRAQRCGGTATGTKLLQAAERYFGTRIGVCDVRDTLAHKSGWFVIRVLVPTAISIETVRSQRYEDTHRLKRRLNGFRAAVLTPYPHPFA
jgi:ribosomal protein S12 methylthiotransferase accessory factor YcaO